MCKNPHTVIRRKSTLFIDHVFWFIEHVGLYYFSHGAD